MNEKLITTRIIKYLSFTSIGAFFLKILIASLAVGGRWDLNEHLAFAERMANGILKYSNGVTDLFLPSSPYFPGVAYLSYFYQKLGISDTLLNNQLLLVTAVSIGLFYFILLNRITTIIYPDISKTMAYFISTILLLTNFKVYIGYMAEFKPDTTLLLIGMIILFLIGNNKKISLLQILSVAFLLFISVFIKQTFFLIFFLTFFLINTNNFLSLKEKIYIQIFFSAIGISAIYMLFRIENLWIFTVETMGKHPIYIKNFVISCLIAAKENIIFLFFLFVFLFSRYNSFKTLSLETKYAVFSFAWLTFSFLSAAKIGGNNGNIEVGIFVLLPFAIFSANKILKEFYNILFFRFSLIFILIIAIFGLIFVNFKQINKYKEKLNNFSQSYLYLSEKFKNKKAFIDGNTYVLAKKSGLQILTEAETIGHFNGIPEYNMSKIKNALENQLYDIIFIEENLSYLNDKDIHKIFRDKYQILTDNTMPSYLINKIYIKKEK